MNNITFRPFDKMDWESFAGATGKPIIAELEDKTLDGKKADLTIVIDDSGLELCYVQQGDSELHEFTLEVTPAVAKVLVQNIQLDTTIVDLVNELGFTHC